MVKLADLPARPAHGRVKRYPVKGSVRPLGDSDDDNLTDRFTKPSGKSHGMGTPYHKTKTTGTAQDSTTPVPIDTALIRWARRNFSHYVSINCCPQFLEFVEKKTHDHLSKAFHKGLQDPKFAGIVKFDITEKGTIPGREDELGEFVKLEGKGSIFILPKSFLSICGKEFINKSYRSVVSI